MPNLKSKETKKVKEIWNLKTNRNRPTKWTKPKEQRRFWIQEEWAIKKSGKQSVKHNICMLPRHRNGED